MGFREALNQHRSVATGVTLAILAVALVTIGYQCTRGSRGPRPASGQAFFSTDDGATWFRDDATKIPPFDKDGKPAYRVAVYECADGEPFVSHMERYPAEVKRRLEAARGGAPTRPAGTPGSAPPSPPVTEMMVRGQREVKEAGTGDAAWVKVSSPEGQQITVPVCPDGTTNGLNPVAP